ncbi:hypothetical protein ACWPKO_11030 [Coraliomargarita sp. W4R53]
MAFVLLLLLTISTLVQVELTSSGTKVEKMEAEQAALLSLNLAIGKLQETAGLDQRVTAPAEAAGRSEDDANLLTGVWRSWEGRDHQSNGLPIAPNYASKRVTGDADVDSSNAGRFLGWLVSSAYDPTITPTLEYSSPPSLKEIAGDTVPLVGAGSVGSDADGIANQIHAEPTSFDDGETSYAWWISGENSKSLLKPVEEPAGPFGWSERFASSTRPDVSAYSITNADELDKVTSRSSLNFISNNAALDEDQGVTLAGKYFHDLTAYSRGLLTNTATGGWRRDLSLMSEQWARSDFPTSNLPFFTLQPGVETAAGKASVNQATSAGNLIYPWSVESDFIVNGGGSNRNESGGASVSWDALVDFAQQYRKVNSIDASGRIHMPLEDVDPRDTISRRPILARVHWVFSFMSRVNDKGYYRVYLVASPVVTFWNPYNVAIPGHDKDLTIRFLSPVVPMKFKFKVGDEEQDDFYDIGVFAKNTRINFNIIKDDTEWAPGESRVYSATSLEGSGDAADFDADDSVHVIELDLGYRTNGGARYPLFGEYAKVGGDWEPVSGTKLGSKDPDDVVTVTVEIEDEIEFQIEIDRQSSETAVLDLLYSVPKAASDEYYDDVQVVNDGNVTIASVLEGGNFSHEFLVAVMQLRNVGADVRSTDSKGYSQTKPSLLFTSNPYNDHELLDAYPYDWKFFTELNSADFLPQAGGDDADSGYVGTSFRSDEGLERLVVYEIPTRPLRSLGELQHFDVNYYNPLPPYTANPIGNSHASHLIAANELWMSGGSSSEASRVSYDHSYVANHLLFDDWFVSSIAPEMQAGTPSITRDTQAVYEDFLAGTELLPNEAYVPAAGVSAADATSDLLSDTDAWHGIASKIEVDGMFNVNSTSVAAWTALLSHLNGADVPHLSNANGDISLESGSEGSHPVSRTTIAGDPSANPSSFSSQVGTHTRLSQVQIEALATQIVEQVKLRGPFLSLSEFVNRQLVSGDVDLARAGAIETALIKLSEMSGAANPYADIQSSFVDVNLLGNPAFKEAGEGNVAYGFPGWVRQADVLRPIAPVLSARDDTFVIRAYGERKDPITGEISARAWCEAVVQRRADYVDAAADDATILPSGATLSSEANQRFGRRFSIVSFRWLSPDEV